MDLGLKNTQPPLALYHGTQTQVLKNIHMEGIKPICRHAVHLSASIETAKAVASRRNGTPVILTVSSNLMFFDGYKFQCSENNVWLTDFIPSKYISLDGKQLVDIIKDKIR